MKTSDRSFISVHVCKRPVYYMYKQVCDFVFSAAHAFCVEFKISEQIVSRENKYFVQRVCLSLLVCDIGSKVQNFRMHLPSRMNFRDTLSRSSDCRCHRDVRGGAWAHQNTATKFL